MHIHVYDKNINIIILQRQLEGFFLQTEQDTFVEIIGLKNLSQLLVQNLIYTERQTNFVWAYLSCLGEWQAQAYYS